MEKKKKDSNPTLGKNHWEFVRERTSQIMQILDGCTIGEATEILDRTKQKLLFVKIKLDDQT